MKSAKREPAVLRTPLVPAVPRPLWGGHSCLRTGIPAGTPAKGRHGPRPNNHLLVQSAGAFPLPISRYTRPLKTAFFAHGAADRNFATELAEFLESGCNVTCYVEDGLIGQGEDLISKAEEGLSADVLVVLLSASSSPPHWPRDRWEPILIDEARRTGVHVATVPPG